MRLAILKFYQVFRCICMSKDSMKPVRAEDIFYINDIIYSIRKCLMSLFAGDCISYLDGNNWNQIFYKLQQDLSNFITWNYGVVKNIW